MIKNIIFAAVVIGIFTLLYVLSTEVVVPIPSDDSHIGIKEEATCFECHGEGQEYARKKDHPPKDRCFKCHTATEDPTKAQE
jgi:hypothetical protein